MASNAAQAYELACEASRDMDAAGTNLNCERIDLALLQAERAKERVTAFIRRARTEARKQHRLHAEPTEHCRICEDAERECRFRERIGLPPKAEMR